MLGPDWVDARGKWVGGEKLAVIVAVIVALIVAAISAARGGIELRRGRAQPLLFRFCRTDRAFR